MHPPLELPLTEEFQGLQGGVPDFIIFPNLLAICRGHSAIFLCRSGRVRNSPA